MKSILLGKNFNFKRDKWLILYTFMAIFQPPFLPIAWIYILGLYTIIWIHSNAKSSLIFYILKESKILWLSKIFLIFFFYILIFGTIDMILIEHVNTFSTRLRSMNQLVLLTFCEFSFVCYLLIHFKRRGFYFHDTILVIIYAGILQGGFAVSAFLVPQLRSLYMIFGDQTLYTNAFFIERRGYGFSMILIDTFGYGLGLIAGYMILVKWTNKRIVFILSLILVLFTIIVNARTGIVMFFIAIFIKLLFNGSRAKIIVSFVLMLILGGIIYNNIPKILEIGRRSSNVTISWISSSFTEMYYLIDSSSANSSVELEDVKFLDNFIGLPDNTYEWLLGTGHHVYDTDSTLGFRTDIGYYNLFWEFGMIGTIAILLCLSWFIIHPYLMADNLVFKRISIFNLLAYLLVLMKAILIGYNPGTFINYLMTFSLYYYINQNKCKKNIRYRKESYSL